LRRLKPVSKSFLKNIAISVNERPGENQVEAVTKADSQQTSRRLINAKLINIDAIHPDPAQPRKHFDDEGITELTDSILIHGVLQPITVEAEEDGKYKLISGERRYRAAGRAALTELPCIVLTPSDSKDRFAKQIVENLVRKDLNPIEKAYAILSYKDLLGQDSKWDDVESALSISESRRKQLIRLLDLPDDIQQQIMQNSRGKTGTFITEKHARALLLLRKYPDDLQSLFDRMSSDLKGISAENVIAEAKSIRDNRENKPKFKFILEYSSEEELIDKLRSKLEELRLSHN
jgi:ParB family chromosome partitioning protein